MTIPLKKEERFQNWPKMEVKSGLKYSRLREDEDEEQVESAEIAEDGAAEEASERIQTCYTLQDTDAHKSCVLEAKESLRNDGAQSKQDVATRMRKGALENVGRQTVCLPPLRCAAELCRRIYLHKSTPT